MSMKPVRSRRAAAGTRVAEASVRAGKHLFAALSRQRRPASGERLSTMDGTRFGPGGQMELRYLGFDQLQNARTFRFEVLVKGAATMQAVVVADMALFLQYRVGIQDGPSLCAARLTADLEQNVEGDHVLTADDLRGLC